MKKKKFYENSGTCFWCPNIYGQQKYPVRNGSGNIGFIKGVFSEKRCVRTFTVSEYLGKYGDIQNAFTKEGAGVSVFFVFFWGGGGGEGDYFSPEQVY